MGVRVRGWGSLSLTLSRLEKGACPGVSMIISPGMRSVPEPGVTWLG